MSDSNRNKSDQPEMEEKVVSLYVARKKLYPKAVTGVFAYWRWIFVVLFQIVFLVLPWVNWGDRQAVLLDISSRKFYIFSLVLYPQDFIYLTGLLVISALLLFLFTAVAGRLWCGYTCPQTVYTQLFMWIEHFIEGDRAKRMKLDKYGSLAEKILKKGSKHFIWLAFSLFTGFSFVAYFIPTHELVSSISQGKLIGWALFWTIFYGLFTYVFAGFMREQVCKYMCPYARFQSAMFDKDTLVVTYDKERGEPRGARSAKADLQQLALGSCIDCGLCVQVCPTGIDIRDGLQYECINCAACIDVCDGIMEKMNYPKGLIRMTTENGLKNKWTAGQIFKRVLRPRILIYTAILTAIVVAFMSSLIVFRTPLKMDVIKDRGVLDRIAEGGNIENVFTLNILNATETTKTYTIGVEGLPGILLASDAQITVEPTNVMKVSIRVQVPNGDIEPGNHTFYVTLNDNSDSDQVREKATFLIRP